MRSQMRLIKKKWKILRRNNQTKSPDWIKIHTILAFVQHDLTIEAYYKIQLDDSRRRPLALQLASFQISISFSRLKVCAFKMETFSIEKNDSIFMQSLQQ